jgi:hypothetical protein
VATRPLDRAIARKKQELDNGDRGKEKSPCKTRN